jgi:tetratricopeptide (TPR) repeat protein
MALGFGFNKAKVLAAAERFVQQGKLQNAVAEYEKIVKEDPKDLTVQNTVGDLYLRLGQNEHAAMYFKKVGDQYAQSGFTVKAIAVYKKLSKLMPGNSEHITKLAELYTQQGLFNDARAQYMQIADGLLRAGDNTQAARIFQRILELDPENAHMQAKLADLYMKIGKKDEARNIFYSAAESLYARGAYEAAAEALGKVLHVDPNNAGAVLLRGMIAADSGDHEAAITYLEKVPDLDSRPEGLRALLRAKLQANSVEGAEAEATKLLNVHNDPTGISSLAEWYISNNRVKDALVLYERNAQRMFPGGPGSAAATLNPLMSRVQSDPEALNILLRLLGQSGDAGPNAEALEVQAHSFAQAGRYAEARDLYKQLSELEPENALHRQNYRQMLDKLGEDSATRILSPEEAAQALMVEELDESAPVVQQKYDPPTETAIEAALTDAELFVSYNVPSKAIPPLEAALPLAPHDIALNQRLAQLYAKAERYGDAARVCQTLNDIYRELGHEKEAARYLEASRRYLLKAGGTPASVRPAQAPARPMQAAPVTNAPMPSPQTPVVEVPAPEHAGEASIQEFSFDMPEHIVAEPEPAAPVGSITPEPVDLTLQPEASAVQELSTNPVSAAPVTGVPQEIELSNEWEDMLTVEPGEVPASEAHEGVQIKGAEPPPTERIDIEEPAGGSSVCYLPDEKVQEVEFYISQQMWEAANSALLELSEIAPDAPKISELTAALAAAQKKPSQPREAEPFAPAAIVERPAVDFLPPPFAAPAPHFTPAEETPQSAASAQHGFSTAPIAQPMPARDPLLDLPEETRTFQQPSVSHESPPAAAGPKSVAPAPVPESTAVPRSTEDILSDFVLDLESTDLADFAPKPKAAPAAPSAPPTPAVAASAAAQPRNGHSAAAIQSVEASATLNDILSDLQEETAEAAVTEEDPETHYNLGIAFKEMGLLDEAIGELQKVCRAIDGGHSFSQPIQAYTWLAQCLVDKGAPEAAFRWYQKALQLPGLDDGSRNAIYYDLGAAYEASGDKKSALANFMEVYGSNIDFRDVASRIKSLKS